MIEEPLHARDSQRAAHGHNAQHGSLGDYVIGFVLSVILTAVPFAVVIEGLFTSRLITVGVVVVFGVAQIVVHMIYFLHMDSKSEGGWTLMALIFTIVIIAIALAGSLWVMYHLNTNMMPMMTPEMMKNVP